MRKFSVLTLLFCLSVATVYLLACNNDKKEPEAPSAASNKDSMDKVVKRGEYLAYHVSMCMDCHSTRDFSKYSGPIVPGTEGKGGEAFDQKHVGIPGIVYARNITPDAETGIGTWTDDEILRAITQGISKKGDTLYPLMPYPHFNHMAKEDLLSIIAFLHTLTPVKNKIAARQLMVPIAAVYPAQALAPSVDANVRPDVSDKVNYGGYLVNAAVCADCHTPQTPRGPDFSKMFAGGFKFDIEVCKVNSANLTSDSATGLGTWTEERFMNKFFPYRDEKNYNINVGNQNTIMPVSAYAAMTDDDLKAVYAYLKTLKPIKNQVEKYPK